MYTSPFLKKEFPEINSVYFRLHAEKVDKKLLVDKVYKIFGVFGIRRCRNKQNCANDFEQKFQNQKRIFSCILP